MGLHPVVPPALVTVLKGVPFHVALKLRHWVKVLVTCGNTSVGGVVACLGLRLVMAASPCRVKKVVAWAMGPMLLINIVSSVGGGRNKIHCVL